MPSVDSILHNLSTSYYGFRYAMDEKKKIADKRMATSIRSYELTKEQEREIDDFYLQHYGKKIRHDWHRMYSAYTRKFDVRYIPDLLFLPKIETAFVNYRYEAAFADKNLLPLLVRDIPGTRTARIFLSCANGVYRDEGLRVISKEAAISLLSNLGQAFVKPTTNSSSGKNCFVVNFVAGKDHESGRTAEELVNKMGKNFCVQERLSNHHNLASLHSASINTFRVTTYIWKDKIHHFPLLLRMGRGGKHLDNAHQGGMFVGVDDQGYLKEQAFTEFRESFSIHPDSQTVFLGHHIAQVPGIIEAAKAAHGRLSQVGMVSWDLTVDAQGTIVFIEANIKAQTIWMSQMSNGQGAFGLNTEEILHWVGKPRQRAGKEG